MVFTRCQFWLSLRQWSSNMPARKSKKKRRADAGQATSTASALPNAHMVPRCIFQPYERITSFLTPEYINALPMELRHFPVDVLSAAVIKVMGLPPDERPGWAVQLVGPERMNGPTILAEDQDSSHGVEPLSSTVNAAFATLGRSSSSRNSCFLHFTAWPQLLSKIFLASKWSGGGRIHRSPFSI